MSDSNAKTVVTFPLAGVLGLIFITLKLCGVIGWSWWWVLSPFWIPIAFVGFILGGGIIGAIITVFFFKKIKR